MEESTPIASKKKVFLPIAIILVLVVGALLAIKASVTKEAHLSTQPIEMVEGGEVPDLQMTALDGSKKSLSDVSKKVTLINFWATWCEACMEEMPSMVTLREKYAPQGFEILAINVDENPTQAVPPILKNLNIHFPIFTDPGNALAEMFDVHAIPLSVMVNKDRKILLIESGGREWNDDETHQLMEKWLKD